jgi:mRNA interferase YafQ
MKYKIYFSNSFNKDYKRVVRRNYDLGLFRKCIVTLEETGTLPVVPYKTHKLRGNYVGYIEAHITPDWLLIWKVDTKNKVVTLTRTGTHSDLFK